jgi:homoserine O-succinyltransferase
MPSPALVPAADEVAASHGELTIGLVNNIPDAALKATERQFMRLLQATARPYRIRFHCFSLPSVARSEDAKWHIDAEYLHLAELRSRRIDGLIVTGAEPRAPTLQQEPYWRDLTDVIDWAKDNTRSTIWSCLAAHAVVAHLDGIERRPLETKCSGVFACEPVMLDPLTAHAPLPLQVAHSRLNEVRENELAAAGYHVLTRSRQAGVDIFVRQFASRFVFFQGHPEYDALSLQREYLRDIGRYLARERDSYPGLPTGYFDSPTEGRLTRFEKRARLERHPALSAELPALQLRAALDTGSAAAALFRNWITLLAADAGLKQPEGAR